MKTVQRIAQLTDADGRFQRVEKCCGSITSRYTETYKMTMSSTIEMVVDAIENGEAEHKRSEKTITLTREQALELLDNELVGMSNFHLIQMYGDEQ